MTPTGTLFYIDLQRPGAGWLVAEPGSPEFRSLIALVDPKLRGEQTIVTSTHIVLYRADGSA